MTEPYRFPLGEPLPADVAAPGGRFLRFQSYPAFGWSWYWRRLAVLLPLVALGAYAAGAEHGAYVSNFAQGFEVAWRAMVAYLILVGGGPLLGVAVRHARLSESREYALLVFAVLVGMFAADVAGRWADDYHDTLMQAHRSTKMQIPVGMQISDTLAETAWRLVRTVAVYFFCGGGWDLRAYSNQAERWRHFRQHQELQSLQIEKQRADMRLSVLQAQVEPHFLYNTMASVRSLVRTDAARAEATIDALVDHLRATLPKIRDGHAAASSLRDQLEICRSYLQVMCVRMGGRLSYTIDSAPELDSTPFPPLMLLSLVENAVKHGIEPKPGPGSIRIHAERETDGRLLVTVSDDGAGLREGPNAGIGLENVRSQLSTRFGQAASLALMGNPQGGATAIIHLPIEAAPA
jgi:two-component sensor histidine kinase